MDTRKILLLCFVTNSGCFSRAGFVLNESQDLDEQETTAKPVTSIIVDGVFDREEDNTPEPEEEPPIEDVCGDGIIGVSETCDDGNVIDETQCTYGTPSCTSCNSSCSAAIVSSGSYCGDDVVDSSDGEICDTNDLFGATCLSETGMPIGSLFCVTDCSGYDASNCSSCGNDIREGDEQCDDGGDSPVCTNTCLRKTQKIATGRNHSCLVMADGSASCWGEDTYGQLGYPLDTASQPSPVQVSGLPALVLSVDAGNWHTCALMENLTVMCWGLGDEGQTGILDDFSNQDLPIAVQGLTEPISAITSGGDHNCALTASGDVWCWGRNDRGQLGDGQITSTPTGVPGKVQGLFGRALAVSAGLHHTCALMDDDTLQCWGDNSVGAVGTGSGAQYHEVPAPVMGLGAPAIAVSSGAWFTCAVISGGSMKCWGLNDSGMLGDGGANENQPLPASVQNLSSGVISVSCGERHTCALLDTDAVQCWGSDFQGKLGDGLTVANDDSGIPNDVIALDSPVVEISAGSHHNCALSATDMKCWGDNRFGQAGTDTGQSFENTPIAVTGVP